MKRSTIFAAALGLTAAAGLTNAAVDDSSHFGETLDLEFEATDSNHDGWISREEASQRQPIIEEDFSRADANDDGSLNQEEYNLAFLTATHGVGT